MLAFSSITARFYFLQIRQSKFFHNLANNQYTFTLTSRPERGIIFDRNGKELALNKKEKSAFITPSNMNNKQEMEFFLNEKYPNISDKLELSKNGNKPIHFCWLERCCSKEAESELLALNNLDIHFLKEPQRYYPLESTASILGSVNVDNIGISGIELLCENRLQSKQQTIRVKKDARKQTEKYFARQIIERGERGKDVFLSIDSSLQTLVYEEVKKTVESFKAKSGAAIVMDPFTGEIHAMVSFVPPILSSCCGSSKAECRSSIPVADCYEPASVMKIFSALAALEEEVVTPDEVFDCQGKEAIVGGFPVTNWTPLGNLSFTDVIKRSSNVGLAKVAIRLKSKLFDHYQRLGFGKKTGIEFPGERPGFVNPPKHWSKGSAQVLSFGYEISTTLLQLAKAICVIANGGFEVKPTLLLKEVLLPKEKELLYSERAIKEIKNIINTGNRYSVKGFDTFGKTGTARCLKDGEYQSDIHNFTFVGFVEKDNYSRAIVTFVEEPPPNENLYASQITAPLFSRIGSLVAQHDIVYRRRLDEDPEPDRLGLVGPEES
jgi:cell division protein FtsI (penicillin-binding protein 3)